MRFTTHDTAPLHNAYAYADANPINRSDPSGRTAATDHWVTGLTLGVGLLSAVIGVVASILTVGVSAAFIIPNLILGIADLAVATANVIAETTTLTIDTTALEYAGWAITGASALTGLATAWASATKALTHISMRTPGIPGGDPSNALPGVKIAGDSPSMNTHLRAIQHAPVGIRREMAKWMKAGLQPDSTNGHITFGTRGNLSSLDDVDRRLVLGTIDTEFQEQLGPLRIEAEYTALHEVGHFALYWKTGRFRPKNIPGFPAGALHHYLNRAAGNFHNNKLWTSIGNGTYVQKGVAAEAVRYLTDETEMFAETFAHYYSTSGNLTTLWGSEDAAKLVAGYFRDQF